MKRVSIFIFSISFVAFFSMNNAKSQGNIHESLLSIKGKVQDVQIDKSTFKQSVDILDEAKGKLSFVSIVADEKGKTTKESFEFYVSDIDKNTIIRKTSGKKLFISLSINNNQKFIKHYKEDKLDSYTNYFEILFSNTDGAQDMVNLFKSTIPLVSSGEKGLNTSTDALNWLKKNISKINTGSTSVDESFGFGDRKDYLATFTVKKTDQKNVSTEEKYELNVLDINNKTLSVKISGTQLSVSIETKSDNRYIKYMKNNEFQGFINNFEIIAEDIDQARGIISALTVASDKSKQNFPDFGNLQKSIDFITKSTIDIPSDKKTLTQKINFTPGNGTKSVFTYAEPDSKGKLTEERHEFYLNDMDANNVNFKVSSSKITLICLSKNKTKFIKYFKDNILQDFEYEVDILTNDIETSREMTEAFKAAIKSSEVQPFTWKSISDAMSNLTNSIKGETIGSDVYKLSIGANTTEPLYVKYVQGKTDSKGVSSEQSFEYYPYTLDPSSVKIVSEGKYLGVSVYVLNKKSFIKIEKDGKQQSFDNGIEIMAFDSRQAQDIAEAIKYLANNSKPKARVWSDKQAAMDFIIANTVEIKSEGQDVKQKISLTNNDPCKVSLSITTADDKGKTTDEIYEFALSDMNKLSVDYKVSGKSVFVTLMSKNKEKLIKAYKNGVQQAYGSDVEIEENDVEIARNVAEAFKSAIGFCEK